MQQNVSSNSLQTAGTIHYGDHVITPPHKLGLKSLVCSLCFLASTAASATEVYVADYYDDGEVLYLIQGWEDPSAAPDADADFQASVVMPLTGGSGGGLGSGQTNAVEPVKGDDDASTSAAFSAASESEKGPEAAIATAQPCPRRRCPEQVVTGRRIFATGIIRVVFQQDLGDGFSMFARRAREEPQPPETNYEVESEDHSCQSDAAERGRYARSEGLRAAGINPMANLNGVTYRLSHLDGIDLFANVTYSTTPCLLSTTCPGGMESATNLCPSPGG